MHSLHPSSPLTCPRGFAHRVPYPPDKALFTPGLAQGSAPRGSHLSLETDKVKHDDMSNRPFVNILLCGKLRPAGTFSSRSNLDDDFLEQPTEEQTSESPPRGQPVLPLLPARCRTHHTPAEGRRSLVPLKGLLGG